MRILISQSNMFSRFANMCVDSGHDVVIVKDVLESAGLRSVFNVSSRMIRDMKKPDTDGLPTNSTEFVKKELMGYLYTRVPDMVRIASGMSNIDPDVVVVHNDVEPVTRMMCHVARIKKIPSIHVPHAIYTQSINRGDIGTDIHDMVTASHLASSGDKQTEWYVKRGVNRPNTAEIGYLPFDTVSLDTHPRQFLGIDNDNPVIVYASSWGQVTNLHGGNSQWSDSYLSFLKSVDHKNNNVIIKTHPNGNNDNWHIEQAKEMGVRCMVSSRHKDNILKAADVVIAFGGSNILFDTALLNNNAILISIGGEYSSDSVDIIESNQIEHKLASIDLESKRYRNNIELYDKYIKFRDGAASERLLNFVESVV